MKVYLSIGSRQPIEFSTKSPAQREFAVSAWDFVKAKICLDDDEAALTQDDDVSFVLQTGMDPDVRAEAVIECGKRNGRFLCRQKINGKMHEEERVRLFQGNLGITCLYVMNRYDSRALPWRIAVVEVLNDSKGRFYDDMVDDILRLGLPHYVIDAFKWQMCRNKFSLKWSDGYTSYDDEDVMLRLLSRLIRRELIPNLYEISRAFQLKFVVKRRMMPLARVTRSNKGVCRNVVRLMRFRSIDDIDDLDDGKIMTLEKMPSADIPAHAIMRTFLLHFVLRRLDIIKERLSLRFVETEREMKSMQSGSNPFKINKWAEAKAESDKIRREMALVRELCSRVKDMVCLPFLSAAREPLTVFDVDASEFDATVYYRRVYAAIIEYSRTCFWWTSDVSDGCWRIPQLDISDCGETKLQKKYSSVYENWCYARMLLAMTNLGFVQQRRTAYEEGKSTICIFEKNGTTVKLIHGVEAKRSMDCEFYLADQGRHILTPDFAIVISAHGAGDDCWIVADAKSDDVLRSHMVEKRNDYASLITRGGKRPLASILFRSGEGEAPSAQIELPPPPVAEWKKKDELDPEELKNDHADDDYRWRSGYGVVPGVGDDVTFHGHVRVNIKSVGKAGRIFEEFMDGIIQTGLRRIGAAARIKSR